MTAKALRRQEYWEAENEAALESGEISLMFRVACRWLLAEGGRRRTGDAYHEAHVIFCEAVDQMVDAARRIQKIDLNGPSTGL